MQLENKPFIKIFLMFFLVTKLFMTETELKIDSIGIYLLKQVRIGFQYYLEKLDSLLNDSVERQMISDITLGAFISGGLDSSLLLSYIKRYKPSLNTYITGLMKVVIMNLICRNSHKLFE